MKHFIVSLDQCQGDNGASMREGKEKDKVLQPRTRHQVTVDQRQSAALGAANRIDRGSGP